jgi:hypothetical protein
MDWIDVAFILCCDFTDVFRPNDEKSRLGRLPLLYDSVDEILLVSLN